MRQLGDLLVWMAMIVAVVAVLYLTPRLSQFMSGEPRPMSRPAPARGLAFLDSLDGSIAPE